MSVKACLPASLRRPTTTITPMGGGPSGADVYRVDADGHSYVLKIAGKDEPLEEWRLKRLIQQAAARSGLAPEVVHVDETHRAVLSEFVVDRSFPALLVNPGTRESAVALLGETLRRAHDLGVPSELDSKDPLQLLAGVWKDLVQNPALPGFVGDSVERMLSEEVPPSERANVLSHNDVNPGNLVFDGERLLLVDWEVVGANDPFYDLAAIAVFFRMDDQTCLRLISAHDGEPVSSLHPRFLYNRRLVAVLCGAVFLHIACKGGYVPAKEETLESALSLGDFYQRLGAGALSIGTPEGQWRFGLALAKASLEL